MNFNCVYTALLNAINKRKYLVCASVFLLIRTNVNDFISEVCEQLYKSLDS